jgi:hypothetical protein
MIRDSLLQDSTSSELDAFLQTTSNFSTLQAVREAVLTHGAPEPLLPPHSDLDYYEHEPRPLTARSSSSARPQWNDNVHVLRSHTAHGVYRLKGERPLTARTPSTARPPHTARTPSLGSTWPRHYAE